MENLGDILGKLSDEDISALKEAAQSMFADGFPDGAQTQQADSETSADAPDLSAMLNADVMAKVAKVMGTMNRKDSRCELINALKPHLSEGRRKKADEAMQLIKLLDLLPMLENLK